MKYSTTKSLVTTTKNKPLHSLVYLESSNQINDGGLRRLNKYKHSTSEEPLVSIIMPVYNSAEFIEEAILSVLNLNYNNVEFIIIDGGSTDQSLNIIKYYENAIDYWFSGSDNGIYDAINKGISCAFGDWLYFLGTDDRLKKDALRLFKPYFFKQENKFLYGKVFHTAKKIIKGVETDIIRLTTPGKRIPHQASFYHYQIFQELGTYSLKYPIQSDHVKNIEIYGKNCYAPKFVNVIVANYGGKGISSNTIDETYLGDIQRIIESTTKFDSTVSKEIQNNLNTFSALKQMLLGESPWKGFIRLHKLAFYSLKIYPIKVAWYFFLKFKKGIQL